MGTNYSAQVKAGEYDADDEESDAADDDFPTDGLSGDKIKLLLEAINTQELHNIKSPNENETDKILEALNQKTDALNDCREKTCAYCSKEKRVEDMSYLQRGQHMSVNGNKGKKYFEFSNKQVSPYRHHFIIKEIVKRSLLRAKVVCIHFSKDADDNKIKVLEEECIFDLQTDELYTIEYLHPRYSANDIVQRAENLLKQSDDAKRFKIYTFVTTNCEHLATWCVVGEEHSFQISELLHNCLSTLFGAGSKIVRIILRALYSYSDEIALNLAANATAINCTLGVISVLYFAYCIIKTVYLIKQYKSENKICKSCLTSSLKDLWIQFGTFAGTTTVSLLISYLVLPLLLPGIGITIGVVLSLLGAALSLAVPKIRKALRSPFQCDTKEIKTLSELKPGDVVFLRRYILKRLILVSEVTFKTDPKQGTVRAIHYSLCGLPGRMEIVEKYFQVNLTEWKVMVLQLERQHTYPPEIVVDRARKRVGERKWRATSNRSDHFCYWAKIKSEQSPIDIEWSAIEEIGSSSSLHLSSLFVGEFDVHLINDILLGDVVEYGSEIGIVVRLKDESNGRKFNVDMVVHKGFFKPYIRLVSHRIDLDRDNVIVHKYHPAHCVSRVQRAQRALDMKDKPSDRWTQSSFIEDILKDQRV